MRKGFFPRSLSLNIKLFYLYRIVWGLAWGLAGSILTLFYLEKGVTLAQFMILMGFMNTAIVLFEIPTGIVADKSGRKLSVLIGVVLMSIGLGAVLFIDHFAVLCIAFALMGIGMSFTSGADTALFYDSIKAEGREDDADRLLGSSWATHTGAMVAGSLLATPLIARFGVNAPYEIAAALFPLMVIILALFVEPPMAGDSEEQNRNERETPTVVRSYVVHLRSSVRLIVKQPEVFALMCSFVVLSRMGFLVNRPYAQPYLVSFGHAVALFGLIFACYSVVSAAASKSSHLITKAFRGSERGTNVLLISIAIIQLCFFTLANNSMVAIFALGGVFLLGGLSNPILSAALNRRLPSENRAAAFSIASAFNSLIGLTLGPLYGYVADAYSLRTSLRTFLFTFGPLLLICLILVSKSVPGGSKRISPSTASQ